MRLETLLLERPMNRSITPLHSGSPTYEGEIDDPQPLHLVDPRLGDVLRTPVAGDCQARAMSFPYSPKAWRTPWRIGSSTAGLNQRRHSPNVQPAEHKSGRRSA